MRLPFFRQLRPLFSFDNRWQLLVNRIAFNTTGPTVYLYRGYSLIADHQLGDQDGVRACISPGLYDPFFETWRPETAITFLDVGANSGGFPFALIKHNIPVSSGICVELNPATFRRLAYNIGSLFSGKIIPLNIALAGESRWGTVKLGKGGVTDSIYGSATTASAHEVTVQFVTLDALVSQYFLEGLDVLKMDIEGAEFEALQLSSSQLLTRCRNLLIEIHGTVEQQKALSQHLAERGFHLKFTKRKFIESNVFWFQRTES